jgi:hypothetical protein
MGAECRSRLRSVLLFGGVFLLVLFINHQLGASLMGNMADRDFMSLWVGGKAVLLGLDPYDPQVWPDLRTRYGSNWIPDLSCPFPLWTVAFCVPLSLLPFRTAVALFMTLGEMGIILAILVLTGTVGCLRRSLTIFSLLLGALLFRPFISALTSGQITPFLLLLVAGGVALYAQGRSLLAALLFAFVVLKPNLFVLFLPALGLLLLARRDWRGLLGLGLGGAGLFAFSWILQPGWLLHWLSVGGKTSVTFGTPTLWGLAYDLVGPVHWKLAGTLAVILVSGATLYLVVRRQGDWLFGMGLAMCGSLLVAPYLWNYDQLLLLFPAVVAFCRGKAFHLRRAMVWFAVVFVIPWALFCVANLRRFDSLSGLVPLVVAGYLCIFCWNAGRRMRHEAASS